MDFTALQKTMIFNGFLVIFSHFTEEVAQLFFKINEKIILNTITEVFINRTFMPNKFNIQQFNSIFK